MNRDRLSVEARAKILWGEPAPSVRFFLTSNGMSAADAGATVRELIVERHAEIRRAGMKNVVIGVVLLGVTGVVFYSLFSGSHSVAVSGGRAKGYGVLAVAAVYGLWKLVGGMICLVSPKSERGSISDIAQ